MKTRVGLVVASIAMSLGVVAAPLDVAAYRYKMDITFAGCGIAANADALVNFPAAVILDPSVKPGFAYTDFSFPENAADLRFADANGEELAYEIDTWDTAGRSLIWVRVPSLRSDTVITAYWGSSDAVKPAYTTDGTTWSEGYVAVWHMNESGTPLLDSTKRNNLSNASTAQPTLGVTDAQLQLGKTVAFPGLESWLSTIGSPSLPALGSLTLEAMAYDVPGSSNTVGLISKRVGNGNGTCFSFFKLNDVMNLDLSVGTANASVRFALEKMPQGEWTHVAATYDGSTLANAAKRVVFYCDGAVKATPDTASATSLTLPVTAAPIYVGILNSSDKRGWMGKMDEVRISNVARSAAWVNASSLSMKSPSAFATYGDVQTISDEDPFVITQDAQVTQQGVTISGTLTAAGSSPVTVFACWGTADGGANRSAWAYAIEHDNPVAGVPLADTLLLGTTPGLFYGQTYYYRHCAANQSGDFWAVRTGTFKTFGEAVFGAPSAEARARTITFSVELSSAGAAPVTVTCFMGTSPDALTTEVETWPNLVNPHVLTCSAENVPLGSTVYYAFRAVNTMPDTHANVCTVWTETTRFTSSGNTLWTGAIDTDWYTDGNWNNGTPSEGARAVFYQDNGTVTGAQDLSIGSAVMNTQGLFEFNTGGRALNVEKTFDIGNATADGTHAAPGGSHVKFVNGTLNVTNLNIGSSNNNSLRIEDGSLLRVGAIKVALKTDIYTNTLSINNSKVLSSSITLSPAGKGHYTSLVLTDSVLTNTGAFVASSTQSTYGRVVLTRSLLSSAGTIYVDQGWGCRYATLLVNDGSALHATQLRSGGEESNDAQIIVSNSVVTLSSNLALNRGNALAARHIFTLEQDPGRIASVYVGGDFELGGSGGSGTKAFINGGTLEVVKVLLVGGGTDVALNVSNGTVKAAGLNVTGGIGKRLSITGHGASIQAKTLTVSDNSTLGFSIPPNGYAQTPIHVETTATVHANTLFAITSPTATPGKVTLLEAPNATLPIFPDSSFSFDIPKSYKADIFQDGHSVAVRISPGATILLLQ